MTTTINRDELQLQDLNLPKEFTAIYRETPEWESDGITE